MTLPIQVQHYADLLLQALGIDALQNGSLTLHFGEGRVQSVKHEAFYRLPSQKPVDGGKASA